jgi:hypothetical protein
MMLDARQPEAFGNAGEAALGGAMTDRVDQ